MGLPVESGTDAAGINVKRVFCYHTTLIIRMTLGLLKELQTGTLECKGPHSNTIQPEPL